MAKVKIYSGSDFWREVEKTTPKKQNSGIVNKNNNSDCLMCISLRE